MEKLIEVSVALVHSDRRQSSVRGSCFQAMKQMTV